MAKKRLPETRKGFTRRVDVAKFKIFITTNFYPGTAKLGEVFFTVSKQGSLLKGMLHMLAITLSVSLQEGISWEAFHKHYLDQRFEPNELPEVPSIIHAIAMHIEDMIGIQREKLK